MNNPLKISLASILILCLLGLWLVFGKGGFVYLHKKEEERQVYVEKIRALEAENQRLIEEIDRLKNDSEYIEETARKDLGMVREGEVYYKFPGETDKKVEASQDKGSKKGD